MQVRKASQHIRQDFHGSRYIAIANFEKKNPKRIGALNEVLYINAHSGKIGVTKEQKRNKYCTTYNRWPMNSKEKIHS